jgi:hypothetical protein
MQGLGYTGTIQDTGTTVHRDATVNSALAAKSNASGYSESFDMSDALLSVYCLVLCITPLGGRQVALPATFFQRYDMCPAVQHSSFALSGLLF